MRILMLVSNDVASDPRVLKSIEALEEHVVECIGWDRGRGPPARTVAGRELVRPRWFGTWFPTDLFRFPGFWSAMVRAGQRHVFDLVYSHDLDTLVAGRRLARWAGKPLVYDAHENFASMMAHDLPGVAARRFDVLERSCLRDVDAVVTVNGRLVDHLRRQGFQGPAFEVPNVKRRPDWARAPTSARAGTKGIYIGSIGKDRCLDLLVAAAVQTGFDLTIAGRGDVASVERALDTHGRPDHVRFVGPVPYEDVLRRTHDADIVFCPLNPENDNYRDASPNKVFEAFAVGRPVVSTQGTLAGELLVSTGAGIACPNRAEGYAAAWQDLADPPRWTACAKASWAAYEDHAWDHVRARVPEAVAAAVAAFADRPRPRA